MKSITFALLSIVPTFAQVIPNGASADLVLGQANFTVNTAGTSATKLSDPAGVVIDPTTRKVFVSDRGNKRVLRFSDMNALASGAAAEWVVGQPNFTSNGMGTTANTFGQFGPGGIYLDTSGRLWVADTGNCRVLRFDNALTATANQPNAARVYGQSNFTNSAPGTSATTMRFPASVLVDSGDRLWVVDIGNNRVLRFNSVSTHTTNGVAASGVLGQLNFTSANALPLEANSMDGPEGITMSSNGTLYVSDFERILRFNNAAALSNGANASGILGQPSFTESTFGGPSANYTNGPSGLLITVNDVLWVCDRKNNRMIYINSASTKSNSTSPTTVLNGANGLLGQSSFTRDLPDFSSSPQVVSDRGFNFNTQMLRPWVDANGALWVADSGNNRVLRFSLPSAAELVSNALTINSANQNQAVLSWPNSVPAGTRLMSSATMLPGSWVEVTQTPVINGSTLSVTVTVPYLSRSKSFFRLQNP